MDKNILNNPKLTKLNDNSINTLYSYYAGFSAEFALEKIKSADLSKEKIILDPWNGTGTTTSISSKLGYNSIGSDLNPVMSVISTAKLSEHKHIKHVMDFILEFESVDLQEIGPDDPLCNWFSHKSSSYIRSIEKYLSKRFSTVRKSHSSINCSLAIMYLALFKSIREALGDFIPSNPTWIKKAKNEEQKIDIDFEKFIASILKKSKEICDIIKNNLSHEKKIKTKILNSSSTNLPLKDESIDFVLSSPPYCTRIDYAVATLPELAILFSTNEEINRLRRSLMGTTTVPKKINIENKFGRTCDLFLEQVFNHESQASKTYYYKNFHQYFYELKESIYEISRVLKPNSMCILVIQDSYYKNIYCNLHKIISEMMLERNLLEVDSTHFTSKKNMANINTKSKKYITRKKATESVLTFIKEMK